MRVTDSGGTKVHVYTYDNIYQVTGVDYPPELSYPSAGPGRCLATRTMFNEACPERSGGLTREAQHGVTFASRPVVYSVIYLWGRCPQTPGI